ncbi:hypothetical protein Pint_20789 [Pistacia integerrima]|uniref:Uncharacterized protein n=1 Tax=Pistacia integerrima TaxID=434235 RepID=A0ACC0XBG5_9ROSI|nr:hypothetical protein Pint_20789 [Pistacia integerrima]
MAGREDREYTNPRDPKDKKWGKGRDKIDDEDITFQRMVAKGPSTTMSVPYFIAAPQPRRRKQAKKSSGFRKRCLQMVKQRKTRFYILGRCAVCKSITLLENVVAIFMGEAVTWPLLLYTLQYAKYTITLWGLGWPTVKAWCCVDDMNHSCHYVLDATDNEPWGPHGTALAEIAQATKKFSECQLVMNVLWTRLGETGKDWRYVYKLRGDGSQAAFPELVQENRIIYVLHANENVDLLNL